MIELLQIKHKGMIILCRIRNFYMARGKDAILLNEIAGLKLSCIETEICKVGFPITSLEKYTDKIKEYRMKIREKRKRKLRKDKAFEKEIKNGNMFK